MKSTDELVERFLSGEGLSEEERARLEGARRADPELDRELADLMRLDARVDRAADSGAAPWRGSDEAVWAQIEAHVPRVSTRPERPKARRRLNWMGLGAAMATAALLLLVATGSLLQPSPGASPPRYELRIEGGERTLLGDADATPSATLASDGRLELLLRPDRATQISSIMATWIQDGRRVEMDGDWNITKTGSAKLGGQRSHLAPDWSGRVELEVEVELVSGASVVLRREILFGDP